MPDFAYSAKTPDGSLVNGQITADTRLDALAALEADGKQPVSLSSQSGIKGLLAMDISPVRLSDRQKAALLWQIAAYLEAGEQLDRALATIATTQPFKKQIKAAIKKVADKLSGGAPLSEAFDDPILDLDESDKALLDVAQTSGALPRVVKDLSAFYETRAKDKASLTAALLYPAILATTCMAVLTLLLTVVVPSFEPLFAASGRELPAATAFVRDIGAGLTDALPFLGVIALVFASISLFAGKTAPYQKAKYSLLGSLPLIGQLLSQLALSRFLKTGGLLLSAGVPLQQTLRLCAKTDKNPLRKGDYDRLTDLVGTGVNLDKALATIWPSAGGSLSLISLGVRSGRLAASLMHQAKIIDADCARQIDLLKTIATPALTLCMGGIIGFIVWAVMSAILDINQLS